MIEDKIVGAGKMGAGAVKTLGAKTLAVIATPTFGFLALAGIVGWELWKAKQGDRELQAQSAQESTS
ncbi:hypothetical protein GF339_09530 [candidate division KSB3 bacterium]|jgi:predicted negative regulator of RcsB-dependent stress response|uniref:Uncharacterized protein n=1 Tax=candidate division KSB3 bacterium TaxID=2044937 RepID=A0A9D5JVB7_9BACT|nr:hypothetical protein [candidate division KSB3 bacterium]MBD3324813.1 hypothetical protein [candidate division KSB3 bacterium]